MTGPTPCALGYTLTLDIEERLRTWLFIPGVGGQSGGGPVSLTLTKAPPCLVAEG